MEAKISFSKVIRWINRYITKIKQSLKKHTLLYTIHYY